MALQDIGFGSKAESSIINENFHYLDDLITSLNTAVSGLQASFNAQIENTRKSLQKNIDTTNAKANNAQTTANKALDGVNSNSFTIKKNSKGCVIQSSFGLKIHCGKYTVPSSASDRGTTTINFSPSFASSDSYVIIPMPNTLGASDANVDWDEVGVVSQTNNSATIRYAANSFNKSINWIAIGY